MSTVLIAGDAIKATIVAQLGNQVALTSRYYRITTATSNPTDADFAGGFETAIHTDFKNVMSNDATFKGVIVQKIWPLPVAQSVVSAAHAGVGTGGAGTLPTQVTTIISWYSNIAGRAGRARNYLPFPPKAAIDTDGTPTSTLVTNLETLATAIFGYNTVTVAGRTLAFVLAIYHRQTHLFNDITQSQAHKKYATQRRRGDYGRPNTSPI